MHTVDTHKAMRAMVCLWLFVLESKHRPSWYNLNCAINILHLVIYWFYPAAVVWSWNRRMKGTECQIIIITEEERFYNAWHFEWPEDKLTEWESVLCPLFEHPESSSNSALSDILSHIYHTSIGPLLVIWISNWNERTDD